MALGALHFFVHAAQRVARLVVVKLGNTADGPPTQRGVAVLAGNTESTVRIARNLFLRKALRPLGVDLEGEEKNSELEESSTEHGATYLGTRFRQSGLGRLDAE